MGMFTIARACDSVLVVFYSRVGISDQAFGFGQEPNEDYCLGADPSEVLDFVAGEKFVPMGYEVPSRYRADERFPYRVVVFDV